jgi:hypothetical protein
MFLDIGANQKIFPLFILNLRALSVCGINLQTQLYFF